VIVADENIAAAIVLRLRADGWKVTYIAEEAPSISDRDVLDRARDEGAILITDDKDFGELVVRERRPHCGVVLLRLAGLPTAKRADMVSQLFREHGDALKNTFTVLNANGTMRTRTS
jgi:predicted nuclease of predicted toxin-antitoxin system